MVEPHMKQETETMEMVKDVQEVHEEEQVQATQEDQPSHTLTSTDTLEITEVVKNEYVETSKEQKDVVENLTEIEVTESVKDKYLETIEEQKDVIERPAELEVTEAVKDEKEETIKEQDNIVQKQEVMQLTAVKAAQHIEITETKAEESDTPIEENEKAMLPEDGILLMYVEKKNWKNNETEMADNQIIATTEVPECGADIPMPRDDDEISKKSQKSRVEDIAVTPSTSQQMVKSDKIPVEETIEDQPVRMNMVDKLIKAASNLENEVKNKENIKIPAIDLLLWIQVALDECNVFPENTTVNILDIINRMPDKSALVWQEKLNGEMGIDSYQSRALADSLSKESHAREQERKQQRKDAYITQKCAEILQNAAKMYKFVAKTAAGLADLAGICDGRTDFKDMMNVVIGLPSKIQQQAETKIKEAEEKGAKVHDKIELVNIRNLDELMTATILPKFDEEWEHLQYEATKYLVVLFEYWLHKGMFPHERLNVHHIAVKFKCSITVLQKSMRLC